MPEIRVGFDGAGSLVPVGWQKGLVPFVELG